MVGEIFYDSVSFKCCMISPKDIYAKIKGIEDMILNKKDTIEIVGNKFENPELLKEG